MISQKLIIYPTLACCLTMAALSVAQAEEAPETPQAPSADEAPQAPPAPDNPEASPAASANPPPAAPAAPPEPEPEPEWEGNVELGYVGTTGNTESQTTNLGFLVGSKVNEFDWSLKGAALSNSQNGNIAAEKYGLDFGLRYELTDRWFLSYTAAYEQDRFSGYDSQTSTVVSGGYKVVATDKVEFSLAAGLGYQNNEPSVPEESSQSYVIFSLSDTLGWQINENTKLTQSLKYQTGTENTTLALDVGITANLIDSLALKVAFGLKRTEEVPAGFEQNDTTTTVSLVYNF